MNYSQLDPIVKALDELLVVIEKKLEKEHQNLIDSGFEPKVHEFEL